MSKIVDALDAPPVYGTREAIAPRPAGASGRAASVPPFSPLHVEEEMVGLHHQLDALLPDIACRTVQFIGSREGEGTSSIAREFALVSATRFGQRVLLLNLDHHELQDSPHEQPSAEVAPVQVGDATLYIGPLPRAFTAPFPARDARGSAAAWTRLRQSYDLIVVDSPPAAVSPEGLAVASQVDGVLLVLEAETTRWPVAARAKESIVRSGGRVLGAVFNKRRHHIPPFIYNWL